MHCIYQNRLCGWSSVVQLLMKYRNSLCVQTYSRSKQSFLFFSDWTTLSFELFVFHFILFSLLGKKCTFRTCESNLQASASTHSQLRSAETSGVIFLWCHLLRVLAVLSCPEDELMSLLLPQRALYISCHSLTCESNGKSSFMSASDRNCVL